MGFLGSICTGKSKTLEENREDIINFTDGLSKHPKIVKHYGRDNGVEVSNLVSWLWQKSNPDVPLSKFVEISEGMVKKFKDYSTEYMTTEFGTGHNKFANYFKLPKRVLGKFKEGDILYKEIETAMDYNQYQTKQGALHVEKLVEHMYDMFKGLGQ